MKNISCICVFLFCIQTIHAQSIKNKDFETGDTTGWTFTNPAYYGFAKEPGYTVAVIKDALKNRGNVAKLTSTGNSQWGQLKQLVIYKPTDSIEKLRVSAYIKLKDVNTGLAGLSVRIMGNGSDFGSTEKSLKGTAGWTKIYMDVLIPGQTDSLLLFCSIRGTGEAFFDDIQIKKIPFIKIEQTPEAKAYLDTAIDIISEHALYKDSVNFNALVRQAHLLAAYAEKTADCYTAIQYVLRGLGDHHSSFLAPEQANVLNRNEDASMLLPSGKKINNNIGYLKIPPCGAINETMAIVYSDSLKQVIKSIDNKQIAGWIVDDRDNSGGNCWPMLLGLGPILGEGVFYRRNKNGIVSDSISYSDGMIRNGDFVIMKTESAYKLHNPFPKVAVLMNGVSGSSGESVILSFKGRPAARLIGEPSYGLTTGNAGFTLSDGAMMFVCAIKQTDRLGNEYGGKIYPDETVTDNPNTETDEVIDAAVKWLIAKE